MITFMFGVLIGIMLCDYVILRINTMFGQRVVKAADELNCYALDKFKLYYEDIRSKRTK